MIVNLEKIELNSKSLCNYSYEDLERFYVFSSSFLDKFKSKKESRKEYYSFINTLSFSKYCQHIIDEYSNIPLSDLR